ncbi:MAG: hypothetical protein AAF389_09585 [Gemmatimonadota bacterium]
MSASRSERTFSVQAEATIFGFDPTPMMATITPRSRAWRVGGAARTMGVFAVIAPFVALFPPHAVWPIGALMTGGFLARRRYIERYTLESAEGDCPKCGHALRTKPMRLRSPHQLPCDACHHELILRLPDGALDAHEAD